MTKRKRARRPASPPSSPWKLRRRPRQSEISPSSTSSGDHGPEKMARKAAARMRAKDCSRELDSDEEDEEQEDPHEQGVVRPPPSIASKHPKRNADVDSSLLPIAKFVNQHRRTRSGAYLLRRDKDPPPARYFRITHPPKLPQPMGDFLEIFQTKEHGRGVRTTQGDIPQGTVLFTEHAAIRAPSFLKDHEDELTKRIRGKVAALTSDQRAAFISLSHADGPDTEETRFARNCFEDRDLALFDAMAPSLDASPKEIEGIYTVWLQIAMLNHSCRPNAIMLIRDAELAIADLIATVDIPMKGTELTISYLRGAEVGTEELLTEERQELLWNGWKFKCSCLACVCAQPVAHNSSNPTFGDIASDRNSSVSSIGFETSDDRLQYMHKLGEDLGLIVDPKGDLRPLFATNFDKLFSQYENLLEAERMIYPLYYAHQKAIEAYTLHYTDVSNDELTYARILYHRERLNKYSRICYGNEEAQKSGSKYVKELKGEINRPRAAKDDANMLDSAKRRKLPMKATALHMIKLGTQRRPIEIEESDGDSEPESPIQAPPDKRRRTRSPIAENNIRKSTTHDIFKRAHMLERTRRTLASPQISMHRDARGKEAGEHAQRPYNTALKKPSGFAMPKIRSKPTRQNEPDVSNKGNTGGSARRLSKQVERLSLGEPTKRVAKVVILDHGTGASRDDPIDLD